MSIADEMQFVMDWEADRIGAVSAGIFKAQIAAVRDLEFQQTKSWALQEQLLTVRKTLAAAKADGGCMVPISLMQAMTGGAACAKCGLMPGCPDCRAVHDVPIGA